MTTRHSSFRTAGTQEMHRNGYDDDNTQSRTHTQFLDLTNGEGGDRTLQAYSTDGDYADTSPADGTEDEEADQQEGAYFESTPASKSRARTVTVDPNTPGKVVETGKEHTGRWTKEEHEAFLSALHMYGKEWKKVAAKVKTRTVVQTRTHAQKYFQKLQKTMEVTGNESITHVDMGVSAEAKRANSSKKKPKIEAISTPTVGGPPSASRSYESKLNRRSSNATIDAAQVISNLSSGSKTSFSQGAQFIATGSSATMSPSINPPRHGFLTDNPGFPSWMSGRPLGQSGTESVIKIAAPDPTSSLKKGFPEPSPAATGKRKLAEMAAARFLAGVGKTPSPTPDVDECPPTPPPSGGQATDAPFVPALSGDTHAATPVTSKPFALHVLNPESLGVTYDETLKRKRNGDTSPVTPWEGQLKALVDEEVSKKVEAVGIGIEPDSPLNIPLDISSEMHPVCGPSVAYGRAALHQGVCNLDMVTLDRILSEVDDSLLNQPDDAGYRPMHSACALSMRYRDAESSIAEIVRRLLDAGADLVAKDNAGNSPLHWAARSGNRDVVLLLLGEKVSVECRNKKGETPLHFAMRAGLRGVNLMADLLSNGANPTTMDSRSRRPVDLAGEGFLDDPSSLASLRAKEQPGRKTMSKELKRMLKITADDRRETRTQFFIKCPAARSLVLHHPECLEHHPKASTDWEAPDRVISIMRRVVPSSDPTGSTETSGVFPHEITVSQDFDRATLAMLSRVHSTDYLSFVNNLSNDLRSQLRGVEGNGDSTREEDEDVKPPVVPFTPLVQRTMIKVDESSIKLNANSDTSFSVGSLKAARRAAGSVQHAVDRVLLGRNRNAFCIVRPPGHHAGINGLLDGGESCGFCIFNNVAAGALYAVGDESRGCQRCAIVDIDVHHGNGTEEIVRKCHDPSKLFFFSIHLYDNDKRKGRNVQYKFYPGTGSEDDLALNIINVPIVPLWREPAPSTSPVRTHNTRNKARAAAQESLDDSSVGTGRGSDNASEAGPPSSSMGSPRQSSGQSGRQAYRQAILTRLLPALRAFNPDLILISAGFDAVKGDVGNARHERGGEKIGLDLEPEDYAWTTRKILEIADICCNGKVVSVLEGGYGRTPVAQLSETEARLDRTVFAECGVRHLQALIDPYNLEQRFA